MRRILTVSALSLGLALSFAPSASAAPCTPEELVQNCACLTVDGVLYTVTGYNWLACA